LILAKVVSEEIKPMFGLPAFRWGTAGRNGCNARRAPQTGAFARQTAGSQGGQPPLVSHLCQRVGLIHELRQLTGAEERVDHRKHGAGVDQILRRRVFALAQVHSLLDGARHSRQTHAHLGGELFADRTHTPVAEVIDIVGDFVVFTQIQQILDDADDVFLVNAVMVGSTSMPSFLFSRWRPTSPRSYVLD
jgi:hypothetical protein